YYMYSILPYLTYTTSLPPFLPFSLHDALPIFNHTQLVGDLSATENNYVWVCRFRCNSGEHVELRLHQFAGIRRKKLSYIVDRCLRAVNNTEAIGDKRTVIGSQVSEFLCECSALSFIFRGFPCIEADIFNEHDIAFAQAIGALMGIFTGDIASQRDVLVQGFTQSLCDWG